MGTFNYSNIHIFDKNGRELPLVIKSSYKIEIPNKKGKKTKYITIEEIIYGFLDRIYYNKKIVDYGMIKILTEKDNA